MTAGTGSSRVVTALTTLALALGLAQDHGQARSETASRQDARGTAPRPAAGLEPERHAWFGTWRLNPTLSTARAEPSPYRRVVLRIEPAGDGLTVIYDMVGTRGGVTHLEWTGRFDGRDYAVQGIDDVLTNAYRQIDDRRYAITVKRDGRVVADAVAAVSADGDTLTVETTERGADGRPVTTTAVYDRQ